MNFIIENWYLIAVALLSGGWLLWPQLRGAVGGAGLSVAVAVQLINREKAQVIDVRDAADYAAGHVGGARNVPLGELEGRLPERVRNKALPLILVCASGARAQRAAGIAKKLGYAQAHVLAGGLKSWKEASLPLEKA